MWAPDTCEEMSEGKLFFVKLRLVFYQAQPLSTQELTSQQNYRWKPKWPETKNNAEKAF